MIKKLLMLMLLASPSIAQVRSYNVCQDEGTPLAQEPAINFVGTPVTCVDDAINRRTTCTITAGANTALSNLSSVAVNAPIATGAGTTLALSSTSPAQITTAQAGTPITITAANAVAGSSVAGAAQGGSITILAGDGARLTSGEGSGGDVTLKGGAGCAACTYGGRIIFDSQGPNKNLVWNKLGMRTGNLSVHSVANLSRSDGDIYTDTQNPGVSVSQNNGISLASTKWFSISTNNNADNGLDQRLYVDSDGKWAMRNSTTAQALRLYQTADAYPTLTNYERFTLTGTAGSLLELKAETAGTGADNLDIKMTPAGTGTNDLSAGIKIPTGTGPTVDATHNIGIDTTADQLLIYGASAVKAIPTEYCTSAVVDGLKAADDNFPIAMYGFPVTITKVGCAYEGTGTTPATIALEDNSGNACTHTAPTCVTSTTSATYQSVTSCSLVAGERLRMDVTNSVAPETDKYVISWCYTVDRQ